MPGVRQTHFKLESEAYRPKKALDPEAGQKLEEQLGPNYGWPRDQRTNKDSKSKEVGTDLKVVGTDSEEVGTDSEEVDTDSKEVDTDSEKVGTDSKEDDTNTDEFDPSWYEDDEEEEVPDSPLSPESEEED